MVAKGLGPGVVEREFGISGNTLLCTEWMDEKILLYSTGNYIQCPVINHNGKECGKVYVYICVCVCVTESLRCTPETVKTL